MGILELGLATNEHLIISSSHLNINLTKVIAVDTYFTICGFGLTDDFATNCPEGTLRLTTVAGRMADHVL